MHWVRTKLVLFSLCYVGCFAPSDPDPVLGPCESNAECESGSLCDDGVCRVPCQTRQQCEANEICTDSFCELGQAVPCSDTEPCAEGFTCILDSCEPLQQPGASCSGDDQCRSGACIGGVCCNRACDGTCESCLASDTGQDDGICAPTGLGSDPGERCGANATCDARGACALDDGAACSMDDECGSGFCVDGVCCDSACNQGCESCLGSVSGGNDGACTFLAAGTERVTTDPVFEDCPGVQTCDGSGSCFAKTIGAACGGNSECESGFCTDGVCCQSACNGECRECSTGACVPVTSGPDPGTCQTCFGDGTCDGKPLFEACTAPSECSSQVCFENECRLGDGAPCAGTAGDNECQNTCIDGSCGPFPALFGQCDTPADCGGNLECTGGFCLLSNGASCAGNNQCARVCIDGQCANQSGQNGACDERADCTPSSLVCDDSRCLLPLGGVCDADVDCSTNNCLVDECFERTLGRDCWTASCANGLTCTPILIGLATCRSPTETVAITVTVRNFVGGTAEADVSWRGLDGLPLGDEVFAIGDGFSSSATFTAAKGSLFSIDCRTDLSGRDIGLRSLTPLVGQVTPSVIGDTRLLSRFAVMRDGEVECTIR